MKLFLTVTGIVSTLVALIIGGLQTLGSKNKFVRGFTPLANPDFFTGYKFSEKDIPDLAGRTVIVTGGNNGLGFSTSKYLFRHGARVVMTCRSGEKCKAAREEILYTPTDGAINPNAVLSTDNLVTMQIDLSNLSSIRDFVETFKKQNRKLHHLVLNAGLMSSKFALTIDGIEESMGVNHIGHFYLAELLIPVMKETNAEIKPTITILSSMMHDAGCEELTLRTLSSRDPLTVLNNASDYDKIQAYCRSKLANVLHANALARKHPDILTNSVHPGGVSTPGAKKLFGRYLEGLISATTGFLLYDSDLASMTQIYTTVGTEIQEKQITGRYFVPIATEVPCADIASDINVQDKLWAFSENILKIKGF
eukprot:snap_masked-scaffold_34-processed-gene-1.57-mRNA-1 protein AED:0.11 eAED:0.11 QI:0/-1/0/1/-1/1/1/0/365